MKKRLVLVACVLAAALGGGCSSMPKYTKGRSSALNLPMPAVGKSKVVFIRPSQQYSGFTFSVRDGDRFIGLLPYDCFFEYECDPGSHRFSATVGDELKVLEATLLPGKIYYAKVAARYGAFSPGVNMYSLYPGCPGELWPQMAKMLGELKEALADPTEVAKAQTDVANYQKLTAEYQQAVNAEKILPEHGQAQPITGP